MSVKSRTHGRRRAPALVYVNEGGPSGHEPRGSLQVNADEKLRSGQSVSIQEIVETYCELTPTPLGKVPAPGIVELLRQKAAEAAERGLLLDGHDAA
jgi:hypothetical protein